MIETIEVKSRDAIGSLKVRKLRATGMIPCNLYGHGEANLNLSVAREAVDKLLKHGTKLVSLTGAVTDTALLREVQWDSFGSEVVHLDFARVSQSELVEISLPVHLHGEAPGAVGSGQLRFVTHEITIRCPAASLPEHLTVDISKLQIGQAIHVSEMTLPQGASSVTPGSVVIVQVVAAASQSDDTAAAAATEPELIRKEKPEADAKA
jgi:large subunit ribosomal protein L25